MCRCNLRKSLDQMLELFYTCTQMPITALTCEGCVWGCAGLDGGFRPPLGESPPYPQGEVPFYAGGEEKCLYYYPICPHGGRAGLFILGPYLPEQRRGALPHLLKLLRSLQVTCAQLEEGGPYCYHIQRAIRYVQENYGGAVSLKLVAERLGLNSSYLSSLFRQQTGQAFTDFVHQVRIEKSKELLQCNSLSILEVSLEVGFNNHNYFNRIFKKLTGITPGEFRRQRARSA